MKRIILSLLCALSCLLPLSATELWNDGFEDGSTGEWKPRGTSEVLSVVNNGRSGGSSLLVSKRSTTWNGPIRVLPPNFIAGSTYRIQAWVRYPAGPASRTFNLSMELGYSDAARAHQYKNLANITVNKGDWGQITYDYTVPAEEGLNFLAVYVETPYKADAQALPDDLIDFQLDDVRLEMLSPAKLPQAQDDIPRLRDVYAGKLLLGAAVTPSMMSSSSPQFRLLTKHFGAIVAENAMKPESLSPREGVYTFDDADKLIAYAERTGTLVRGHTLVWHNQTAPWMFQDAKDPRKNASKAVVLKRLENYVSSVVGHFKGTVDTWDVVNEVISDTAGLRTGAEGSKWHEITGTEYLDVAFRAARKADPSARLAINDYSLEGNVNKREELYKLVKAMKARGVPVDVVGLQGHISLFGPSVEEFRQAIRRFASLGVMVQVTELDVSIYTGSGEKQKTVSPEILARQAQRYAELFAMFMEEAQAGRLDMVVLWGVTDDGSWLNDFPVKGRADAPLLFDRNLQAKPAFWAVVDPASVPAASKVSAKQAKAVRGSPSIDGTIDSLWSKAAVIETGVATSGENTASGKFRVLWDDSFLYVLAEVSDPSPDDSSKNVYEQDSVEVFVDQNNNKSTSYESDDGQYRVNFKNMVSFNGNKAAEKNFKSASVQVKGGYLVEMAIPFTELKPKAGTIIGFDAQVNDGQDGGRIGIRNFNDNSNSGWQSTAGYGLLTLEP